MELGGFVIKLFVSMVMLSVLLFGTLMFMRRKGIVPYVSGVFSSGQIKVLSSARLTPRAHLFVVRVSDKRDILIGVTDRSVSFICELEDKGMS